MPSAETKKSFCAPSTAALFVLGARSLAAASAQDSPGRASASMRELKEDNLSQPCAALIFPEIQAFTRSVGHATEFAPSLTGGGNSPVLINR